MSKNPENGAIPGLTFIRTVDLNAYLAGDDLCEQGSTPSGLMAG
ncbi:hypothetical protein [Methylobacterium currus]|nr:hypothetical protein [Methylobacterium currus]